MKTLYEKQNNLATALSRFDALAVAFSGGVDSSYLLAMAKENVKGKLIAVTAVSPVHPGRDVQAARVFAENLDIEHMIVQSTEMSSADFVQNLKDSELKKLPADFLKRLHKEMDEGWTTDREYAQMKRIKTALK